MIDIHSHLLPGVDDGARTFEQSIEVLARLAADGVTCVVCTPHLRASEAHEAPFQRNAALLAELAQRAAPNAPELRQGWEIMLDRPGVELSRDELRLAGSNAVLVEFPRSGVPPRAAEELYRLRSGGVVPVLAHPERYFGCSVSHVRDWRAAGAVMQGDATMLLGKHEKGKLARALLEHGLLDLLAGDNHGDHRTVRAARDWLVGEGAATQATLLTATNPARLLAGLPLQPVPPVTVEQGVLRRLRELLLGRA